jgi:hypothetical protein
MARGFGGFGGGGFGGPLPFGGYVAITAHHVNVGDTVTISEVIIITHPQGGGGYGGMSYGGGPWGGFDAGIDILIEFSETVPLSEALTISTFLFTFVPAAVSSTKVRLTFETSLRVNAALTDPTSYTILDADLNVIPVALVIVEGDPLFPTAVSLVLGTDLVSSALYDVNVGSGVVTSIGSRIFPDTKAFQWFKASQEMVIRFKDLSGEVQGGLFGTPEGLVFFSPSLTTSAPNSIIQIDDVSVCTRAYDVYTFPSPPDPSPLFTFSTTVEAGTLNGPAVLFAPWDRLVQARFNLGSLEQDTMPPAFDGQVSMVFRQPFDPNFVSLLNDPAWALFKPAQTPLTFICANNLGPIPSGPTTILILGAPMIGDSDMADDANVVFGAVANPVGDASASFSAS